MIVIKLLNLTDKVFNTYVNTVKGRNNTSFKEVRKILTRNMLLAHKADSEGYRGQMYQYGRLWFVVIGDKVVWLKNHCHKPKGWVKDNELYNLLNKELGIKTNRHKEKVSFIKKINSWFKKLRKTDEAIG